MSVNYNIPTRNSRLQEVISSIDAGASNGVMKLYATGAVLLANIPLSKPCGTVSSGVLTFAFGVLPAGVLASGSASSATIENSSGTVIISGLTVGTSTGYDLVMTNTSLTPVDVVQLASAIITSA